MAAKSLFLGLDVGTQGTKALLIDLESQRVLARASSAYGLIEGLPPGAAEQHPSTWIEAIRAACAELFRERPRDRARVGGVGVSGQQHGLVVLDEQGEALRAAKLWCDTATAKEAEELSQRLGQRIPVGYTASKITWLAQQEPRVFERVARVLLPHDYVNFVLTGKAWMECGDASGTGFFDAAQRRFDARAMQAVHPRLAQLLPPLVAADALPGVLDARGAQLTGLAQGTPVSAGSGDNMCSAIGSGATRAGVLVCSLGTSATIFHRSERPLADPEGLIAPFCDASGAWMPLLCVMNATGVSEEVRRAFALTHERFDELALSVDPGAGGLLFLPYLAGERVPDLPQACGVLHGVRGGSLEPAALARAALEGVALNLAWGLERLRALGTHGEELHLVGGASRSRAWKRVLADVLGLRVRPLAEPESAALGAALQAAWAVSRSTGGSASLDELARGFLAGAGEPLDPDPRAAAEYRVLGARFRELVRRNFD
ncbi:MAG: xylulokinase [Planctomycetes bacterium]|nr:xylulokinase [Planctomycetota bacterium]